MGECYFHGTSTPCKWCAEERGVDQHIGQPLNHATCLDCGHRVPMGNADWDGAHGRNCPNRPSNRGRGAGH